MLTISKPKIDNLYVTGCIHLTGQCLTDKNNFFLNSIDHRLCLSTVTLFHAGLSELLTLKSNPVCLTDKPVILE